MDRLVQGDSLDVSEHLLPAGDPQLVHVNQLSASQAGKFDVARSYNADWTGHIYCSLSLLVHW
jgi:hypothetical protein